MIHNPELRRNIWLDFTPHRLLFTPLILGLLAYIFKMMSDGAGAGFAYYAGCFFLFIWGTRAASDTVMQEVGNNTWDFQRQSAISPWSMTIGKWLGSTLFSWYGVLICLLLFLPLQSALPEREIVSAKELLSLLIGGLFSQALGLLLSIQILPQIRHAHSNKTFSYFLIAAFTGIVFTSYCYVAQNNTGTVLWHHHQFNTPAFFTLSYLIFLAWTVLALYRSFSKELQYQSIPWVWLVFNLYCMIYFSGFGSFFQEHASDKMIKEMPELSQLLDSTPLYIAFSVITLLCYLGLFSDSLNSLRYRKILTRLSENNITETLQEIPWWIISLTLTIVVGIITCVAPNDFKEFSTPVFILTSLLFLVRDILLAHYFYFSKNPRRAQSAVILYLAILWIAVPVLFGLLNLQHLLPAVLPSWGVNTPLALVSIFAQIGLFGFLVWQRWESIWAPEEPKKMITLGE
jgi:hypothetical protein